MTFGFRWLSRAWAVLGRGIGTDGAVVPGDLSVGGEGHETFADGAMVSLLPRSLSHPDSSG
ncbi:hypothetical protein GCM10010168_58750 [Actinoplanes ianthinogenes]|uniref:Uncharacterized protein n=1 Tax=Actinoplanes ianthinogenes TaxID=122358 RepID=A0ABN6CL50_9ACTN|nr:hypothetical protein Aiant_63610 [Actinoplanes ianthinogenes]GGR32553.1 hypothetical protein GCM10010168_58750 [Actinoplanes ianthinogenes]